MLESCIGNERDCCKIVIFGKKLEYLSNWRILFLRVNNSWNKAVVKLLSRLFCFSFFKIFINIDRDRGEAGLRDLGFKRGYLWSHLPWTVLIFLAKILGAILMLTRHEPSAAVTHSNNVTSQLVQEAFGFAVRVKEPQLRHSTVSAVGMWQVWYLKMYSNCFHLLW